MDYDAILAQALELLQQEKRLSYRVLKRRLNLEDDDLEDLKEDLIYAKKLAVDEDNRVLVWVGESETQPESATTRPVQPEVTQQNQPTQPAPPPTEHHTPDAERRQLTVMFCDLVDSTKLSSQLDPEDYREVVREYQQVCAEVIQRYDGHIAQYLGDGLLVYFGYPVAHEDDAQRAIHTGLGIIDAIRALNTRLEPDKGIKLAVRLGIHTGLVVVGAMGGAGRQEQLALGDVPNIAARIQGLAAPDTVVMSADTYRLVEGYFDCRSLGEHILRGVSQSLVVYQVLQKSGAQSRLDVASTRGLTPLVGREQEVGLLLERWEQAKDGQGQIILLSGEAGIGKSRLVQVLKDHIADGEHVRWECRSLPYYTNTALYPITDLLQRTLQFQPHDTSNEKLAKLEQVLSQYRVPVEETVPLFAPLLSLSIPEDRYPSRHLSPQRQRQKTLETSVAILLELAARQPVLFIVEDLHWTDPTTLELLELLIEQTPTASIYALFTCRPEFEPTWGSRSYLAQVTLNRLTQSQIAGMAEQVAGGKHLPAEVLQQIITKTDGVPLFVEEMTKAVLESGTLKDVNGQYALVGALSALAIPATLHDSLMARLDRLMTAKGIAQLGAVLGRQFSYELLQAVSQLDAATLQRELGRLIEAELVYPRGLPPQATYTFKHALVVDAAYESLLKSTRQQYHQKIAQVLEERFPETAANEPELLAHHYTEAGRREQAVDYWHKAGQQASERSAHIEAVAHLTKGLALLETLPESIRDRHELRLLLTLGSALHFTKGFASPEVQRVYSRAQVLCQQMGETSQLFDVLDGLRRFYMNHGELQTARELAEQTLHLAHVSQDFVSLLMAHYSMAGALLRLGELTAAHPHFERVIVLSEHSQECSPALLIRKVGSDIRLHSRIMFAHSLWLSGYPDQARQYVEVVLNVSQELSHAFTHVFVLFQAGFVYQFCGDVSSVQDRAQELLVLCSEQKYESFAAGGTLQHGWVLAEQGQWEQGIEQIRQGLTALRATGQKLHVPLFLTLLASVYGAVGQTEEGLTSLAEALAHVEQTGERYYEAEISRLKGELLLSQSSDSAAEAESCFKQAITIAQNQQAKSLELRAVTSLARLWREQGKKQEAYDVLAPVYGWFTEGFDTADLKDAKALLDELA